MVEGIDKELKMEENSFINSSANSFFCPIHSSNESNQHEIKVFVDSAQQHLLHATYVVNIFKGCQGQGDQMSL
jgi:hypothetical protein